MSSTYGIFQSDIIIRTAIKAALDDLRANPWLLDYVFISLPQDPLTFLQYGDGEIDRAKKWFATTDIPVIITPRIDAARMPCISIALEESSETSEATLADVNYETTIDLDQSTNLAGPFTPTGYNYKTGKVLVRKTDLAGIVLAPGMLLVDIKGTTYPIIDVYNDVSGTDNQPGGISSFDITPNTVFNMNNVTLQGAPPMYKLPLESTIMKETYSIGCHVNTDFTQLIYLHSILVFALLRYKQRLFEARGFERSTISSSAPQVDASYESELVYERFISLSGVVRQFWPKDITSTVQGVTVGPITITGSGNLPGDTDPDNVSWIGNLDIIDSVG